MGSPLCCMSGRDEFTNSNNGKIINYPEIKRRNSDPFEEKLEKIQK
jgi:hypothetical protein